MAALRFALAALGSLLLFALPLLRAVICRRSIAIALCSCQACCWPAPRCAAETWMFRPGNHALLNDRSFLDLRRAALA